MELAYLLLNEGEANVTEAAFRVGYSHPAAFCTAFRREYGFTPGRAARTGREAVRSRTASPEDGG